MQVTVVIGQMQYSSRSLAENKCPGTLEAPSAVDLPWRGAPCPPPPVIATPGTGGAAGGGPGHPCPPAPGFEELLGGNGRRLTGELALQHKNRIT